MTQRLYQVDRLVQLAELREEAARRGVAAALHALSEQRSEKRRAEAALAALSREQAERRAALRDPLIGSAQLRGALSSVLTTFEADRDREAQAQAAIAAAAQAITAAEKELDEARTSLLRACRLSEKRRRMRAPIAEAIARQRERREEAEAEETRMIRRVTSAAAMLDENAR
ncbi:hypothetical protein [Paracoccus sediminicola]|uniref:hypothetical protein n=1 Tax=Paracoccus sediminicola TaxID=3017783 RepID=UPI0022F043CC|nr:hypothetical protein [Paracoccus sediminicola]WBU57184.1 hypothetical protein PAF18_01685 [Paracoccus sediminicola]